MPLLHEVLLGNWKNEDVEVVFISSEEDKLNCCLCFLKLERAGEKGRDKNPVKRKRREKRKNSLENKVVVGRF